MPKATITIAFVNPPKEGAKSGTLKTKNNEIYGCWPDKLGHFAVGKTYEVEYTEREHNGKTYKNVTHGKEVQPPAQTTGTGNGGGYTRQPTSPVDAERMFVCGAINAAIQGGHLPIEGGAVEGAVNAMRQVWEKTFGASEAPY